MNFLPQIMFHMKSGVINGAFRTLFALLDSVVYGFISIVFQLIFQIGAIAFDSTTATAVTDKVYVILTVFMIFKIIVSMITYLVNPDTITDKQQGAGKLIGRVIVTLMMLIMLPLLFDNFLMDPELHEGIMETLPRLILGKKISTGDDTVKNMGDEISWSVLKGFVVNNKQCSELASGSDEIVLPGHGTTYLVSGGKTDAVSIVLDPDNIKMTCDDHNEYKIEYTPIISTIAGGFLLFILVGMAINVGVRLFKLIVLRIIAPIPIMSYVDPKSGKDGAFNKWLKALFTTWAELYIQLAVIYFVMYLVASITSTELSGIYGGLSLFGKIFITLSLFFFAKQAPKFISNALGLPEGSFGEIMKMTGTALGVGAAGIGIAGAGLGAAAGSIRKTAGEFKNARGIGKAGALVKGLGRGFGSAVTGVGSGIVGGAAALKSDKGQFKAAMDARRNYINERANGRNLFSDASGAAKGFFGYDLNRDISHQGKVASAAKQLEDFAKSEGAKRYSDKKYVDANGMGYNTGIKSANGNDIYLHANTSRNDVYDAVQKSRVTGENIQLKDATGAYVDLGYGADSSFASKLTGDFDEYVGDAFLADKSISGNVKDALDSYQTAYANATGSSKRQVAKQTITDIKGNRKTAERNKANLEIKKDK